MSRTNPSKGSACATDIPMDYEHRHRHMRIRTLPHPLLACLPACPPARPPACVCVCVCVCVPAGVPPCLPPCLSVCVTFLCYVNSHAPIELHPPCHATAKPCCSPISVTGWDKYPSFMGLYSATGVTLANGKRVYRHSKDNIYLFYSTRQY